MNRKGRYLFEALVYAAVYYVIGRIFWPSQHSPVAAIPSALAWGLIVRALATRREYLESQGKEPYRPIFYFGTGLVGLGLCVASWLSSTPRPTGLELFGLLAGIAVCAWVLAHGFTVARRSRAEGVGSGT